MSGQGSNLNNTTLKPLPGEPWGIYCCMLIEYFLAYCSGRNFSHQLFAIGKRYQFVAWAYLIGFLVPVPFWICHKLWPRLRANYLYTPVIWWVTIVMVYWANSDNGALSSSYYIGWLCVGINSSILSYFAIAWASQWWLRTRYPHWFTKYNYILAAALDGGTQVSLTRISSIKYQVLMVCFIVQR